MIFPFEVKIAQSELLWRVELQRLKIELIFEHYKANQRNAS